MEDDLICEVQNIDKKAIIQPTRKYIWLRWVNNWNPFTVHGQWIMIVQTKCKKTITVSFEMRLSPNKHRLTYYECESLNVFFFMPDPFLFTGYKNSHILHKLCFYTAFWLQNILLMFCFEGLEQSWRWNTSFLKTDF